MSTFSHDEEFLIGEFNILINNITPAQHSLCYKKSKQKDNWKNKESMHEAELSFKVAANHGVLI